MKKLILVLALVGLGSVMSHIPWKQTSDFVVDWFEEPSVSQFKEFFVSDTGTAYTLGEFEDIGGMIHPETGVIMGLPICPQTGATEFRRIIGRVHESFGGDVLKFEPAEQHKAKMRIKAAKGGLDWNQFYKTAEELRKDEAASNDDNSPTDDGGVSSLHDAFYPRPGSKLASF